MNSTVKLLLLLSCFISLNACVSSTPLVMAAASNHLFLKHQQKLRIIEAAAQDEEPDLITYSVKGIAKNKSKEVIETYLFAYNKKNYSQDMKALALYQIAVVYMSRFNEDRDDNIAKLYLQRHQTEFPNSIISDRIEAHLKTLEKRKKNLKPLTPNQVLAHVNVGALLSKPDIPYDEELNSTSIKLIKDDRLADAQVLYVTVYENPGSSDNAKSKALYQLGLIYMSPHNKKASFNKSTHFFRMITNEFAQTKTAYKAQKRITQLINQNNETIQATN